MAKLSADDLIEAFKELSLIELSDFVKKFEEVFEVTAAAPVAVAAAAPAAGGAAGGGGVDDILVHPMDATGEAKLRVALERLARVHTRTGAVGKT